MSHIASCKGIEYSSPTLASAISNLTPAFTFTLAVIFRFYLVLFRSSVLVKIVWYRFCGLTLRNLKTFSFCGFTSYVQRLVV